MAENIQMTMRFDVDVDAPLKVRAPLTLLAEADKDANRIEIVLTKNGKPIDLNGVAVTGSLTRADGAEVGITGSAQGNVATAVLNEYSYAVPGTFSAYVQMISAGGVKRTILLLAGYVQPKGHGEQIDTGKPLPSLDEVIAQLEAMRIVTEETMAARDMAYEAAENVENAVREAEEAAANANNNAREAENAAGVANETAERAENAAEFIRELTVESERLPPGSNATVTESTVNGHLHLKFGLVTGDKGERGEAYLIKGRAYATVSELRQDITNPSEGDQYNVGVSAPYNIYRWTGSEWEDQGKLQGIQGYTYTPSVSDDGVLSWTNNGGLENPDPITIVGMDGKDGENGEDGKDGVGVLRVLQTSSTTADGGLNVWTMTMTDGSTSELRVRNGRKGSTGETGPMGPAGEPGVAGEPGATGEPGKDGYTPVKGVDYFTSADKEELVNDVLGALPTWTGGSY